MSIPKVLTIAGSDSVSGMGIQADIKTFAALRTYGASVVTAVTAQNTQQVIGIQPMSVQIIEEQIRAIFEDLDISALKIGMLVNAQIIETVISAVSNYNPKIVVLDPVMISKHDELLFDPDALDALKSLIPLATVVTPNIPELASLGGFEQKAQSQEEIIEQAQSLIEMGAKNVLVKGGHLQDQEFSTDYLICSNGGISAFKLARIDSKNSHGAGCTLSAAITAELAKDPSNLVQAIRRAKLYVTNAVIAGENLDVGNGVGPLDHFYHLWQ